MGRNANEKLSKWLNGMDNMESQTKMKRLTERDAAITNLIKVCGEKSEDLNIDICSTRDIEVATEYIQFGFSYDLAFKYAVDYGLEGLKIVHDLNRDYGFNIE